MVAARRRIQTVRRDRHEAQAQLGHTPDRQGRGEARLLEIRTTCRSCDSSELDVILPFGDMPLENALPDDDQLLLGEDLYPITLVFCRDCFLVQTLETVAPEVLFGRDYPYYSSFSETLLKHSRENALSLIQSQQLGPRSLVVELASNDGYLLKNFKEQNIPVLGIDPAEGPASEAEKIGIPTMREFFGIELATRLRDTGIRADVVIGNNVLAHVADLNGFVAGIAALLTEQGTAVIEAPYLKDLIDHCEFDTIYHEHHCYFSVSAVDKLFARHGLTLTEVEHHSIHGGTLRYFAKRYGERGESVRTYLESEASAGLTTPDYYSDFAGRVRSIKHELTRMVGDLKRAGKRVAGYAASAKGAVLLNFAGLDSSMIDFVVDKNVHKQGKYMPGLRISIREPEALLQEMPDYVLILAWNFKDEILRQQDEYTQRGGRWIVPIPYPAVLESAAATATR